jgi:hypothetical protein
MGSLPQTCSWRLTQRAIQPQRYPVPRQRKATGGRSEKPLSMAPAYAPTHHDDSMPDTSKFVKA